MRFSIISNAMGALNKTISLQEDGTITKKHPSPMYKGIVKHYNKKSLGDLVTLFPKLRDQHALVHGVPKDSKVNDEFFVRSKEEKVQNLNREDIIARSKQYLVYMDSHLAMLDHDPSLWNPHPALSPENLITTLAELDPQWGGVGHIVVPSSSAGIMKPDGRPISDSNGYHLYFHANNAKQLHGYMMALFKLSVIAGHGFIKISRDAKFLVRSCFDQYVFSPERIDFTAAPTLEGGLVQERKPPIYTEGTAIDCRKIPAIDEAEYNRIVDELKAGVHDKQQEVKAEYILEEASKMAKRAGIPVEKAAKILDKRCNGSHFVDIYEDEPIYFEKFGWVLVKYVLKDLERYDGGLCSDVGEPDENDTGRAIFYANLQESGKPVVQSFLHGECTYFLHGEIPEPQWDFDDLEAFLVHQDGDSIPVSVKSELVDEIVSHTDISNDVAWDGIRKLIKKNLGINMGAVDAAVKGNDSVPSIIEDDRTHAELTTDFIIEHLPHNPNAVGCEGVLWAYNSRSGLYEEKLLQKIEVKIGNAFSGDYCKRGGDYRSIARLVYNETLQEHFFESQQYGVACKNSYICIKDGELVEQKYTHKLRQRFKLDIDPIPSDCPLFSDYLNDSFAGDEQEEQTVLLQEILGGLVTGTFRKVQKAVLLHGAGENGKSVFLELLDCFFPAHLKSAVSPSDFGHEYNRALLAGKVVNIVGELEQTKALPSASFKDIIGCDTPLNARIIYKEPFSFKPTAGHIFSSNHFPQTKDHTHGFYRRWVILDFHNRVEESKKIPNLGALIAAKEAPQVLAWALIGAKQLVQNGFKLSLTKKHEELKELWKVQKDSVYSFIYDDEEVLHNSNAKTPKPLFYAAYCNYCIDVGLKSVGRHTFYDRCLTRLGESKTVGTRVFLGVSLVVKTASAF